MENTRTRHRLRAVNVLLIVALLAIAGGAYLLLRDPGEAQAAASTTAVQRGNVTATVSASGNIESTRTLQASFVASGTGAPSAKAVASPSEAPAHRRAEARLLRRLDR